MPSQSTIIPFITVLRKKLNIEQIFSNIRLILNLVTINAKKGFHVQTN